MFTYTQVCDIILMLLMKIENKKNHKKKIFIILVLILLVAAGVGAYYYFNQNHTSIDTKPSRSSTSLEPATDEQKDAGDQSKSTTVNPDDTSSNSVKNSNPDTPPSNSSTVNVQTTAGAQNGTTYQLRYLIETVANDAVCTLTLTNGSRTVTKTAKTQALAQSSTCQGFNIATSELSPGSWQATMTVSGGGVSGSATSTIKVQ